MQTSVLLENARLNAIEAYVGTDPILRLLNGTIPSLPETALSSNTLLGEGDLPSDWLATASSRAVAKTGTAWSLTGQSGAGTGTAATFWRLYKSDGTTCVMQGKVKTPIALATSALTAVNGNVLTFSATTGVAVGNTVSGTGIPAGATVVAVSGTTVTLSLTSTAGVSSGASITFGADMTLDNVSIANGQAITVSAFTLTGGNL